VAWPYIQQIAQRGLEGALAAEPALRHGLNIHNGEIVHPALRESLLGAPETTSGAGLGGG
jgi:alanine dehydrogenase